MISPPRFSRRYATRLVALGAIASLYRFARLPTLAPDQQASVAARFQFTALPLPEVPGATWKTIRAVNPSLQRIQGWISSVGAAVSLADLDGDGLPNDLCYVDPRTDQVIVAPAPGTSSRYPPFTLDPRPLPYDSATMAPMGCLPGDFDDNGVMDLLVYYWGRTPVIFLRRDSPISFAPSPLSAELFAPSEVMPDLERWYTNTVTQADLDGDGRLDLVVGNYFPDGARVLDTQANDQEQMQHSMSRASNGGGVHFLLRTGAASRPASVPQYTDTLAGLDPETRHGWTLAVAAGDLDGDLLPELYVANDFGPDHLLHNLSKPGQLHFVPLVGRKTFTTPSSKVLGQDSFKGMGVDLGDLTGRGLFDIVVSNITSEYALEESNFVFMNTNQPDLMSQGVAPFVDQSESLGLSRSGWAWDVKLADFDNSGSLAIVQTTGFLKGNVNRWPELQELAMGNDELLDDPFVWPHFGPGTDLSGHQHLCFYVRAPDGHYYDLADNLGLAVPHVSRGIAVADVDGDGRLDFAVANQWEPSFFYRNTTLAPGRFLGLHLLLPLPGREEVKTITRPGHPTFATPGRPAIGTQILVHLLDGRQFRTQVDGGNGHSGKRSPEVHVGLGQVPDGWSIPVDLRWRDGEGEIQQETLSFSPGWHTVLLGGRPTKEG